jgi:hypothetical protein
VKIIKAFYFLFLLFFFCQAQIGVNRSYNFISENENVNQAFLGNGIVDILVNGGEVWVATGYGLNRSINEGITWQTFNSTAYNSKGGITAIAAMDSQTIWIATAFDTSASGEDDLTAGGGLSYTQDGGLTWQHVKQPVDSRNETEYSPTTTVIQNITYDIAVVDSTIWIASFGGGLRRSDDMGQSWQVVTTDNTPFSSLANLNHRAFSLLSENGNLWYGSADGISKSADNGQTWQRFTHQNQEYPISGNFVVALAYHEQTNTIWAATIEATGSGEFRAVSKTSNGGLSWQVVLEGIFAHNFGFAGQKVFVASDEGLFISEDVGDNWYLLPQIQDAANQEKILSKEYFSAASQSINGDVRWWLGSADGLATKPESEPGWKVVRSFVSTRQRKDPQIYAYPTAFSPARGGYTRIQYDISGNTDVNIKIYSFAMEHVVTLADFHSNYSTTTADRSTEWNGRDSSGNLVASGLYFLRVKIGNEINWGRVVIIN